MVYEADTDSRGPLGQSPDHGRQFGKWDVPNRVRHFACGSGLSRGIVANSIVGRESLTRFGDVSGGPFSRARSSEHSGTQSRV
ncbi:MAG: hypothetical protein NTW75_16040, partial [Planctomycetales bacterium]|nr:hypothetical protein [Planctomycetales bacterium]